MRASRATPGGAAPGGNAFGVYSVATGRLIGILGGPFIVVRNGQAHITPWNRRISTALGESLDAAW